MMVNMMVSVIHHLFPDLERGNSRRRHIFALYLHSSPPQCSVTFSEEEQETEFKWLTFRDHRHFRTSRQGNVDKIHCCQGHFYVQYQGQSCLSQVTMKAAKSTARRGIFSSSAPAFFSSSWWQPGQEPSSRTLKQGAFSLHRSRWLQQQVPPGSEENNWQRVLLLEWNYL